MHWLLALLGRPAEVRWLLAMMIERFGLQALLRRFALLCFLAATTKMRGLPSRRWRHEVWSQGAALAFRKGALVPRGDDEDERYLLWATATTTATPRLQGAPQVKGAPSIDRPAAPVVWGPRQGPASEIRWSQAGRLGPRSVRRGASGAAALGHPHAHL